MGAVVVACLAAQLGSIGHHFFVRHARCAAHGETIDVALGGHRAAHDADHAEPRPSWQPGSPDADVHQHCTEALGSSGSALQAPPPLPAPPAPVRLGGSPVSAEPHASSPLLLLAPKTSPPA